MTFFYMDFFFSLERSTFLRVHVPTLHNTVKTEPENQHPSGFGKKNPAPYREVKHAVFVNEVIGPVDMLRVLQVAVVDAGVREAPRQVGAGQRLMRHLWDGHLVAELPHVLVEKVCVAHVERRQGGVEGCNRDGGDLGSH